MPDFTELPIPQIEQERLGPDIGSAFPEIVLPDQSGQLVDLHQRRAGRPAMVVFHRSADW